MRFTEKLQRPELLSRIGDNIVVFGFISEPGGRERARKYLAAVVRRVQTRPGIKLQIATDVAGIVEEKALENLAFGGRGIGSVVETQFVNPLTRALMPAQRSTPAMLANHLEQIESSWTLKLTGIDGKPVPATSW